MTYTVSSGTLNLTQSQAMLKCSKPSPIMFLHHICKAIPFLSPVLFIPSLYYAFSISENFYLLVMYIVFYVRSSRNMFDMIIVFCWHFQEQYELLYDVVIKYLDCFATYSNFK